MRSIINISVPAEVKTKIETAVKAGNYATKSEFFRHLLRLWQEDQAFRELELSRRQISKKKGKTLRSLKDLES